MYFFKIKFDIKIDIKIDIMEARLRQHRMNQFYRRIHRPRMPVINENDDLNDEVYLKIMHIYLSFYYRH